jgi:beta-aspartyl-peptidase (threonine type)
MDASIMDGRLFDSGAVAALRNFPNPIRIARRVLDKTEHLLLAGPGAEAFARKQGFQPVPIESLLTPREIKRLELLIRDKQFQTPHAFGKKRGTVGAVAVDEKGNFAAATSTGGTPKKIPGRVGDTPIIGCGTWAENKIGAISCTGWGESIMKMMLAREVAEKLRSGLIAQNAADKALNCFHERINGLGGIICIDKAGHIGMSFNTPRMARGYVHQDMNDPIVEVD